MEMIRLEELAGLRVTVMGLGLNGGGVASARFLAERGAHVTVTDTKDEGALSESVASLAGLNIRFVLGCHDEADFREADLVIKNPAVRPDNAYLQLARKVETDLSIFLALCPARIVAVTGSKGKSTTATAIAWMLNAAGIKAFLGGNITVSPLSFLDTALPEDIVVLELSSWQLGDLRDSRVLKPFVAVLTRIVPDHLDRYGTMESYVADKRLIYANQDEACWTICDADDPYGLSFASETRARVLSYGSSLITGSFGVFIPPDGGPCTASLPGRNSRVQIVPQNLAVPGAHTRRNLAAASLAAWACGAEPAMIARAAASFTGVEHRLEPIRENKGVTWYNDSAATVPEAVVAAIEAFDKPVVLITGGTDKKLDFEVARKAYGKVAEIILLAGTGTEKIRTILEDSGISYHGPYDSLPPAVQEASKIAKRGYVVVLSPGCTSFGMFKNEFDRGRSFKAAVANLP